MATINLLPGVNETIQATSLTTGGADTIKIPSGTASTDTIFGFENGTDKIDISALTGVTPAQLIATAQQYTIGGLPATRIQGSFGSVFLRNFPLANLDTTDFLSGGPQTITAPAGGNFGFSLAAVGTNAFVVGAPTVANGGTNRGQAYRYTVTAPTTVATTYNQPVLTDEENFGFSVDSDGTNVLIGAPRNRIPSPQAGPGNAYLLNATTAAAVVSYTNTNTASRDQFGFAVAIGSANNLIGAPGEAVAGPVLRVGAADIKNSATNADVASSLNPDPVSDTQTLVGSEYGFSVDNTGANYVVGDAQWEANHTVAPFNSGRVHVINGTTGAVTLSINNPTPGPNNDDRFGFSVAVNPTNGDILVGAPGNDNAANDNAGAAYLFNSAGTLKTTFINPAVATGRGFGGAVEFAPDGDILIGSPGFVNDAVIPLYPIQPDVGAVYRYDNTGGAAGTYSTTATETIASPNASADGFGAAITTVGTASSYDIVIAAPFFTPGALIDGVFPAATGQVYFYDR